MTIERLEYEWAESGTKTPAPSDEKIQSGWVGGDRPSIEFLNFLANREEEKINDLIDDHEMRNVYSGSDQDGVIATQLWGVTNESWVLTDDSDNVISVGDVSIVGLQAYHTATGPRLLVLQRASNANIIHVYNPRTLAVIETSGILLGLDTTGKTWEALEFCTDGTSVYVMFRDTTPANDTYLVQAYNISDWAVKTGWPATGTALSGSGTRGESWMRLGNIIVANATHVATCNPWTNITANTDPAISYIAMSDGTLTGEGAGDATFANGDEEPTGAIASDGTYLYYGYYSAIGGNGFMASVEIAQIGGTEVGCGGVNWPYTAVASRGPMAMQNCGGIIASSWEAAVIRIIFSSAVRADHDIILEGTDANGAAGNRRWNDDAGALAFDGFNLWIRGHTAAGLEKNTLCKFDLGQLMLSSTVVATDELTFVDNTKVFIIAPKFTITEGDPKNHYLDCSIVSDGRDVWTVGDYRSSQTLSGKIYRVPKGTYR
jgi:hypothetical protein